MSISLRAARAEDVETIGRICFEAFHKINTDHNFPPELPTVDVGIGLLGMMVAHPGFYVVVAEDGGRIVGSNALDERSAIAGIGPITVDPKLQNSSIGRALMGAVLERAASKAFPGV